MSNNENKQTLDDFSWDSWGETTEDLFETPVEEKEEVKVEEKKEDTPEAKDEPEKKEEKEPEVSFEENDFETEEVEEEKEETNSSILSKLKDEGVFSVLDDDSFEGELNDEDLSDWVDKEVEARVEESFESFFESMDEDAIAFLKFKKEGGNTSDFFKVYSQQSELPTGGDIDDEVYQERVIRHAMNLEGYDKEDIDDRIEWLKEGAKMKNQAKKYENKLDKIREKEQAQLLKEQQVREQQAQKQREKVSSDIREKLDEVDNIGDFVFGKKEKKNLHGYITKPKVRVGKNKYITQLQQDLSEVFKNPEKILVLAKLLSTDFDVSDIQRNTETKVTKKTKEKIERKSNKVKSSNSTRRGGRKALHEYF